MRNKWNPEDYYIQKEVEASTKINKEALLDNILHGVPIPKPANSGMANSGLSSGGTANESSSLFSMDYRNNDYMLGTAMQILGAKGMSQALQEDPTLLEKYSASELMTMQKQGENPEYPEQVSNVPHISQRQWTAIQKYPALIEFLGSEHGEAIATEVATKIASVMVSSLDENAKKLSKYAHSCESAGRNIKQFFVNKDEGWVCQVTANGPFRGDEALYYNSEQDKPYVLRLRGKEYEDISASFNVIHEVRKVGDSND